MTEPLSLFTALLLGLFGASHCLVMCGGIAATVGAQVKEQRVVSAFAFNGGRVLSYTLAGLLVGGLGLWLQSHHHGLMLGLRAIAGVLLLLMGLYIARWAMWLTHIEKLGQGLWRLIQPTASRFMGSHRIRDRFWLGMLWGWLPCGLIYSTLSWVAANGDPINGALAMLFFGLGTLPAMLSSSLASVMLMRWIGHRYVRQVAGLLLIVYGLWTLAAIALPDLAH